jgi:hypothetical protein
LVQVQIQQGSFTDLVGNFRDALPVNMLPVPKETGISSGYLKPASGIVARGVVPGPSQGCFAWRGVMYAVCANVFGRVNADYTWTPILTLTGTGRAVFAYSFDKLGFTFGGRFYLSDGVTAARVIDPDLGTVNSVAWIDGYFVLTDGEFIITTDLTDPTQIDPLKYGSAESSPDPVVGVIRVGSEVASVGTNTIEYFSNVGGAGFPFQRVPGAVVQKGAIHSQAFVAYLGGIAFIGGADGEPNAVWVAGNGSAERLSTREIETLLGEYSDADLASAWLSTRTDLGHVTLFLHMPDKTLVYDARASQVLGAPVWFVLNSGYGWRVSAQAWCYSDWVVFDTEAGAVGVTDMSLSSHWGDDVAWEFSTPIIYNASARAIIHELELVALPGRAAFGVNPTIGTKYSTDGITWSQPKFISAGAGGDRTKRLRWLQQGPVQNWRIQKFFGTSAAHLSVARLEANIEGMAW